MFAFPRFLRQASRFRRSKSTSAVLLGGATAFGYSQFRQNANCEIKRPAEQLQKLLPNNIVDLGHLRAFKRFAPNGEISRSGFSEAMGQLGVKDESVIQSFFECFDTEQNNKLSYEEFVAGIAALTSKTSDPNDTLSFVFNSCDLNGEGTIRKDELQRMVHALLVTRENLHVYDTAVDLAQEGKTLSHSERQLRHEKELQNRKRSAYASSGPKSGPSIFSIFNIAQLRKKNNGYEPHEDVVIQPISADAPSSKRMEKKMSAEKQRRLEEIYKEFPQVKGRPMDECLACLSTQFATHVFNDADVNKDARISYKEFEQWASKGHKDVTFLFSLFDNFRIIDKRDLPNGLYGDVCAATAYDTFFL